MREKSNKEKNKLSNEYNKLVIDAINRKFVNDFKYYDSEDEINNKLNDTVYEITVMYIHSSISKYANLNDHISKLNKNFLDLHKRIAMDLLGGNVGRRTFLQPFCWMFIDASGTRAGGFIDEERARDNTHHHGLMYVHPSNIGEFKKLISDFQLKEWARQSENVCEIHIKKMDDLSTFRRTADYAGKLPKQLQYSSSIGADLDFIVPPFKKGDLRKFTPV